MVYDPRTGQAPEIVGKGARSNMSNTDTTARAQGCLLGQLAGDALGSLVEFGDAHFARTYFRDRPFELADGGHWNTLAGQPTDDSELALMLARALVKAGAFDERAVAGAYAHWYQSRPFDVGGTTRRALYPAAAAVAAGADPAAAAKEAANPDSQANGALMRVSPLGIFGHAAPAETLAEWARADARLTHPHRVCQDASAVFAVTIAHAITTGEGPEQVLSFARRWADESDLHPDVRQTLSDAADGPPDDYSTQMGWVRVALQNAFYRLRNAASLERGVVDTVLCGGDTDTNAAIAGALLGAVHGAGAVPAQWRDRVLSCRPERGRPGVYRPRPPEFWPVDAMELAERLLRAGAVAPG